jgi:Bacterial Ig-like domain
MFAVPNFPVPVTRPPLNALRITSNSDNITSDNTPTFTGQVPTNDRVNIYNGTTLLGTTTADANGDWSFTPIHSLPDGNYSIIAKAMDAAGNESSASAPTLPVTIDAVPPKVTVNPLITNDPTPPLTGTIDDPSAVVEVKLNRVTYPAINKGDGTWFIPDNTIAPLPDGAFDILVTAKETPLPITALTAALTTAQTQRVEFASPL